MSKVMFSHRLSVGVSDRMNELLEELAICRSKQGQPISKAELIREAMRLYLDEQPDVRGSRREIAKSLEGQITGLQEQVGQLAEQLHSQHELIIRLAHILQPLVERIRPRQK